MVNGQCFLPQLCTAHKFLGKLSTDEFCCFFLPAWGQSAIQSPIVNDWERTRNNFVCFSGPFSLRAPASTQHNVGHLARKNRLPTSQKEKENNSTCIVPRQFWTESIWRLNQYREGQEELRDWQLTDKNAQRELERERERGRLREKKKTTNKNSMERNGQDHHWFVVAFSIVTLWLAWSFAHAQESELQTATKTVLESISRFAKKRRTQDLTGREGRNKYGKDGSRVCLKFEQRLQQNKLARTQEDSLQSERRTRAPQRLCQLHEHLQMAAGFSKPTTCKDTQVKPYERHAKAQTWTEAETKEKLIYINLYKHAYIDVFM